MTLENSMSIARRAKEKYESDLRVQLEKEHKNEFVAIEPDSGDYFLSESFSEAIQKAKRRHPDKIS